jgi:quinoprotein glucose dehydrogenase
MYTPPTLEGTLMVPGNAGGSNWGGVAVDEARQRLVANTMSLPWAVQLVPRDSIAAERARGDRSEYAELAPMRGTPYVLRRTSVLSPLGVPCGPPPWGQLAAVDLARGELSWQVTLGTTRDVTPLPLPFALGTPTLGAPLLTESGLVFIAATLDWYLRAFDAATGAELWRGRLPTGGFATPMTYRAGRRQFVVIAAMGYARAGVPVRDELVAFALPEAR